MCAPSGARRTRRCIAAPTPGRCVPWQRQAALFGHYAPMRNFMHRIFHVTHGGGLRVALALGHICSAKQMELACLPAKGIVAEHHGIVLTRPSGPMPNKGRTGWNSCDTSGFVIWLDRPVLLGSTRQPASKCVHVALGWAESNDCANISVVACIHVVERKHRGQNPPETACITVGWSSFGL